MLKTLDKSVSLKFSHRPNSVCMFFFTQLSLEVKYIHLCHHSETAHLLTPHTFHVHVLVHKNRVLLNCLNRFNAFFEKAFLTSPYVFDFQLVKTMKWTQRPVLKAIRVENSKT